MERRRRGEPAEPQVVDAERDREQSRPVEIAAAGNGVIARSIAGTADGGRDPAWLARKMSAGGNPLPGGVRSELESGIGHPLDHVRVHSGADVGQAALAFGATAFTVGNHVFLGSSVPNASSDAGFEVLAHEATHTLQNHGAATGGGLSVTDPGDAVEVEAERVARTAVRRRDTGEAGPVAVHQHSTASVAGFWGSGPDTRTDRQKIDDALKTEDSDKVNEITNVGAASVPERLKLLGILHHQWWTGPEDEDQMEAIWRSFGPQMIQLAGENLQLWKDCIDDGAELEDFQEISKIQTSFVPDVTEIARGYLKDNKKVVSDQLTAFGLPATAGGQVAEATPEQLQKMASLQEAAAAVAILQNAQEHARKTYVGYDLTQIPTMTGSISMWVPATYNPAKPPMRKTDPGGPLSAGPGPSEIKNYDEVNAAYDEVTKSIADIVRVNPAVYAITRDNSSQTTTNFVGLSPAAARTELAKGLHGVIASIEGAGGKLGKDLDPLDLVPIHDQMFHGQKSTSGTDWSGKLATDMAREQVKSHEFALALRSLGLQLATEALFLIAPFTGGASLLVMLAGAAVAGANWAMSESRYQTLADAAKASPTPGTELVQQGQVEAADAIRTADKVAFALAAVTVGIAALGAGIGAIRARLAESQRAALLAEAGNPSTVNTWRPNEVPYTDPPDVRIAKPGQPLNIDELKPNRRYLWVLDEEGNFRVADEGQDSFFGNRRPLPADHPAAGESPLKHGDLVPGPNGQTRGAARAGGELHAEIGPDGKPTGRWLMDNNSSYTFQRTDAKRLGGANLEAAHKLLKATGTDTSRIVPVNSHGVDAPGRR